MKKILGVLLLLSSSVFAKDLGFPDPYPEVYQNVDVLPYFCTGWKTYKEMFDPLLKQQKFKTVIEVGVFYGNWTKYIAPQLPKGSKFYAIDPWESNPELDKIIKPENLKNIFRQFVSNMIHLGLTDVVIPVRMRSVDAARVFAKNGIKGDLIYIDGAHDYISVMQDLKAWYPHLAKGGILCGDDYDFGGVNKAVKEFAKKKRLKIVTHDTCWQLVKP